MGKLYVKRVHIGDDKYHYVLKVIEENDGRLTVKAVGFLSDRSEVQAVVPKGWPEEQGFREEGG